MYRDDRLTRSRQERKQPVIGKRRQMIFAPDINPNSFVFFFQKGDSGNSWSIRDYSEPNRASGARYAHEFGFSADQLWSKVMQNFDAPTHSTADLGFWHRHTQELNRSHLGHRAGSATPIVTFRPVPTATERREPYPILDRDRFERHPKARKPQDRDRMLFSQASEDWVTWTAFRLLERYACTSWWRDLVDRAKAENPQLALPHDWDETPEVRLWRSVSSPSGYEKASRERMRSSNNPVWVARSLDRRPVEGASEIDIILQNRVLVVFLEAKLGSDISLSTTYDPHRNQIIRNIDCVLDRAEGRVPMFWMLVRDAGQSRSYTQVLNHYRTNPEVLAGELRHHDAERVIDLARNLGLILWKDLVLQAASLSTSDDKDLIFIKNELRRRV
jgi:hypothetical protein